MTIDYANAIIELDHDEGELYRSNEAFKQAVIEQGKDLSDQTGRVVVLGDYDGYPLDYIDEDGIVGS